MSEDLVLLPSYLRRPPGSAKAAHQLKRLLRKTHLNTVCEEARCPNITECFSRGTATFMILGDVCTRGCRFCAVKTGRPHFSPESFKEEAKSLAQAVEVLGLRHVVITSVARDDLEDGGASGFVESITLLRKKFTNLTIEVLIPDFRGSKEALKTVLEAGPDILNHNLETVPRLYRRVRPGANYLRSLNLLTSAREIYPQIITKTGIMLGLGEEKTEVITLMKDAKAREVDIFTAGQYLRPTREHLLVDKYLSLEEFEWYQLEAKKIGFLNVAIGPLVRSSYHAEEFSNARREISN